MINHLESQQWAQEGGIQFICLRRRWGNAGDGAASRLAGLDGVYIHEFEAADIVRSGLVRTITARYEAG